MALIAKIGCLRKQNEELIANYKGLHKNIVEILENQIDVKKRHLLEFKRLQSTLEFNAHLNEGKRMLQKACNKEDSSSELVDKSCCGREGDDEKSKSLELDVKKLDAKIQGKMEKLNKMLELEKFSDELSSMTVRKYIQTSMELHDVRRELIAGMKAMKRKSDDIGIITLGELSAKPFENALLMKHGNDVAEIKAICLSTNWQSKVMDPSWRPFKIVEVDGITKEVVDEDNAELKQLLNEYGHGVCNAVKTALSEINEHNPRERYPVSELWNFGMRRKATVKEGLRYVFKKLKEKRTRLKEQTASQDLEAECVDPVRISMEIETLRSQLDEDVNELRYCEENKKLRIEMALKDKEMQFLRKQIEGLQTKYNKLDEEHAKYEKLHEELQAKYEKQNEELQGDKYENQNQKLEAKYQKQNEELQAKHEKQTGQLQVKHEGLKKNILKNEIDAKSKQLWQLEVLYSTLEFALTQLEENSIPDKSCDEDSNSKLVDKSLIGKSFVDGKAADEELKLEMEVARLDTEIRIMMEKLGDMLESKSFAEKPGSAIIKKYVYTNPELQVREGDSHNRNNGAVSAGSGHGFSWGSQEIPGRQVAGPVIGVVARREEPKPVPRARVAATAPIVEEPQGVRSHYVIEEIPASQAVLPGAVANHDVGATLNDPLPDEEVEGEADGRQSPGLEIIEKPADFPKGRRNRVVPKDTNLLTRSNRLAVINKGFKPSSSAIATASVVATPKKVAASSAAPSATKKKMTSKALEIAEPSAVMPVYQGQAADPSARPPPHLSMENVHAIGGFCKMQPLAMSAKALLSSDDDSSSD